MTDPTAAVTEVFQEQAKKSRFELKLMIGDDLPDPMRWDTITLLKGDLERDTDILRGLVLHECAHRLRFPGEEDKLVSWAYAAWAGGHPEPLNVMSLVSDTMVHKELLTSYPRLYRQYLENAIDELESLDHKSMVFTEIFRAIVHGSEVGLSDLASRIYHTIFDSGFEYEKRVQRVASLLSATSASVKAGKDRSISETGSSYILSADMLEKALRSILAADVAMKNIQRFISQAHIYLASSIEPRGMIGRLDGFLKDRVQQLRRLSQLPENMAVKQILGLRSLLGEFQVDLETRASARLIDMELAECEKHMQDVWRAVKGRHMRLTEREVKGLIQMLVRVRLTSRGVKLYLDVSEKLRGTRTSFNPPPTVWNLGDPIQELSIPDTYRIYGVFAPGVLAVRKRELVSGKHASNMAILLDVSGSMAISGKIHYCQEIAFFLIEAAKRKNDTVSFIPFSSQVDPDLVRIASNRYDLLQDLVSAVEPSGRSTMAEALATSLASADEIGRQTTFILTDGGIMDYESIGGVLNELLNYGNLSFFIVGERLDELGQGVKDALRGKVYECDIYKPFSDEAVVEYFRS
ncbi:MAG: VWA domain-containing protein [Thaumarchaeota archaeon]|nr:VWA domain-containing protein [Nitrososphaerota archaeon]